MDKPASKKTTPSESPQASQKTPPAPSTQTHEYDWERVFGDVDPDRYSLTPEQQAELEEMYREMGLL